MRRTPLAAAALIVVLALVTAVPAGATARHAGHRPGYHPVTASRGVSAVWPQRHVAEGAGPSDAALATGGVAALAVALVGAATLAWRRRERQLDPLRAC